MTSHIGIVNLQTLALVVCAAGTVGPALLMALHHAFARPVPGLLRVAKGSALMVPSGIALALNQWADTTFATYSSALLAMAGATYWYEGFRELSGQRLLGAKSVIALFAYALMLGAVALEERGPMTMVVVNSMACAALFLACANVALKSREMSEAMYVTVGFVIGSAVLLMVLAGCYGLSGHQSYGDLQGYLLVSGIGFFLCAQGVMVGIAVSASKTVQRVLEKEAATDHLTGLLNRRELMRRGDIERNRCIRDCVPISVLMLDIDRFKQINDAHGHQVGDTVIVDLSKKITEVVRPYDLIARYGGEEFVAVLPGASESVAAKIAERIRYMAESGSPGIPDYTVSVGVYTGNVGGLGSMVGQADAALYEAKGNGRNRVVICDYKRKRNHGFRIVMPGINAKAA